MYKTRGFRFALLTGALLCSMLALSQEFGYAALLLWATTTWLLATVLLLSWGYHWLAHLPWQLVPGLLLAALLWSAPDTLAAWLWAFAILMMLPQPHWMMGVNSLLASASWWQVAAPLDDVERVLSGIMLATLLLAGATHAIQVRPLWLRVRQRQRLVPGLRLWSAQRLEQALAEEIARSEREPLHGELLLLHTSNRYGLWLALHMARAGRSFEHCYRLDRRTLVIILVDHSPAAVRERCHALLATLGPRRHRTQARTLPLAASHQLAVARSALAEQRLALVHVEPEVQA